MIMVEVVVPAIDKEYDFRLDEYVPVHVLTEEITEMICHKEQSNIIGNEKELILCDCGSNRILEDNMGLNSLGIRTGDRLLLI